MTYLDRMDEEMAREDDTLVAGTAQEFLTSTDGDEVLNLVKCPECDDYRWVTLDERDTVVTALGDEVETTVSILSCGHGVDAGESL